jgi:hypothetical protein
MASKKTARKAGLEFGAKTKFVLRRPKLSAQEVVAAAKEQGIPLTAGHVYNIRSQARRRNAEGKPSRAGASTLPRRKPGRPPAAPKDLEAQLRNAIAQVGLARAREVLEEVERAFGA